MTEILTESFCERCGTRYTFETKAARSGRGRGFRTLSSGLKNFVLSDDTSLGDALAAARSEQDREVTNQQLDAFHKTFNFCMQCRQYTCANCWNEGDGFCLTCAPHLGHDVLEAPFPTAHTPIAPRPEAERVSISAEAWPALDLSPVAPEVDALPAEMAPDTVQSVAEPVPDPVVELVAKAAPEAPHAPEAPEPVAEPQAPTAVPAEPTWPADIAAAASARTRTLFDRLQVGQSLDAELADFERDAALDDDHAVAADAATSAADAATSAPDTEGPAAPPWIEAGPIAAEAAWETEQISAATSVQAEAAPADQPPAPEPEPATAVEPVATEEPSAEPTSPAEVQPAPWIPRPAEDVVTQPVWRIVAPDEPGPPIPASNGQPAAPPPVQPPPSGEPQWPTASTDRLEFLRRPRPAGDMWTASTQDLLAPAPVPAPGSSGAVAIQACSSCGLSLSATARFCRRCGTRQG